MSVYDSFHFSVPAISYCVLHQARKDVDREEYIRTMRSLHERVREESEKLAWSVQNEFDEERSKSMELMKSRLRPFLQTPIKSDEEEVGKVISEGLDRLSGTGLRGINVGSTWSGEGQFMPASSDHAVIKRMVKEGRKYLGTLGFQHDKSASRLYESLFFVEGGINLDVLEHIIRDRVGIYSATHGQHLQEYQNVTFSSFNLVSLCGELSPPVKAQTELVFFFSKPAGVRYAPYRAALSEFLQNFHDKFKAVHSSMWQRKLGLGAGREYIGRVRVPVGRKDLKDVGKWLGAAKCDETVRASVIERGALCVKEYLV
ncbi:MAG TPA: hypothetical protein VIH68_07255 [Bacteroidota bacterium]